MSNRTGCPALALLLAASACSSSSKAAPKAPPTVQVRVEASDASGGALHFAWRSSDGAVEDVDAPATTWTLPPGPGLHFLYVLASNGKGGYTERRVAVSTDAIGAPAVVPPSAELVVPPAPAATGHAFRSYFAGGQEGPPADPGGGSGRAVYLPGVELFLEDTATRRRTPTIAADLKGEFSIPGLAPGTYDGFCSLDGAPFQQAFTAVPLGAETTTEFIGFDLRPVLAAPGSWVTGQLVLEDGSPCGTVNRFFGVEATARAVLLDAAGAVVSGPVRLNELGQYSIARRPGAVAARLECEGAAPVVVPFPARRAPLPVDLDVDLGRAVVAGVRPPAISGMTATLAGASVGLFLPPPSNLPSDAVPRAEQFLSYKGSDSRLGACLYYQSIGAVKGCDASGRFTGAVSFDDWKRAARMDPYAPPGVHDVTATFINKVDLNLTRNHHSISFGPDRTVAYVCNHLGPAAETQEAEDKAIDDALGGRNLVACVAMDHQAHPGVDGGKAFTRYFIFGPSGELLPSVNLDGRREKFAPGVCVACHGADEYAGGVPAGGRGSPDLGAHFLPYDTGNFHFSSKPGLGKADQEAAIHALNQNVLQAGPTPATAELIAGWYAAGPVLDEGYLPPSWQAQSAVSKAFYREVYARSCRTCHVAFAERFNFDRVGNVANEEPAIRKSICGGSSSFLRNHSMPNSLVTFDRLWASAGSAVDQPAIVAAFLKERGWLLGCGLGPCARSFDGGLALPVAQPQAVAVADLDADGRLDLAAVTGTGDVAVFLGNGDGTFRAGGSFPVGVAPTSIAAGFLDADGFLDLAVANFASRSVSVLAGVGDGTFRPQVAYPTGGSPTAVRAGNLRGGFTDLVVASTTALGGAVEVLLGDGAGAFAAAVAYPVGAGPSALLLEDLDRDGVTDVVAAGSGADDVSVLRGVGDGTLRPRVAYPTGVRPIALTGGDLDGDTITDLAVANQLGGSVSILLGNGDATFVAGVVLPVGASPGGLVAGELTGSGKLDLAVTSTSTGAVRLLRGNGDGTFQPPLDHSLAGATAPGSVAAGDLDADFLPDLVIVDPGGSALLVSKGTCR